MAEIATLSRQVAIELFVPNNIVVLFSNHTAAQATDTELLLSFFQVAPPIVQSQEEYDKIASIRANCITRLALPYPVAAHLAELLRDVLAKHAEKVTEKK